MGDSATFNSLLDQYKTQYLKFLTSGDASDKTAYRRVYDAIEKLLLQKQGSVDKDKKDLQHFAKSYQKSNKDLNDVTSSATRMIRDAQTLHDEYKTSENRYDAWTENPPNIEQPIDVSNGYSILLRIGIFMMLLPVLLYVGYMVPDLAGSGFAQSLAGISSPRFRPSTPFTVPSTPRASGWLG
jgi:hypothetical protein